MNDQIPIWPLALVISMLAGMPLWLGDLKLKVAAKQAKTGEYFAVDGTVLSLTPPTDEQPGHISYGYVVDDVRYENDRFRFDLTGDSVEFQDYLKSHQVGDQVDVYVDPSEPKECVLSHGPALRPFLFLAFILGSIAVSSLLSKGLRYLRSGADSAAAIRSRIERAAQDGAGVHEIGVKRLRLLPFPMSPELIGIYCFALYTAIAFALLVAGDWAMELWNFQLKPAVLCSVVVGTIAGFRDYLSTVRGIRSGKWDLVIDQKAGNLQLPAVNAWDMPVQVDIDDIVGLSVDPMVPKRKASNAKVSLSEPTQLVLHSRNHGVDHACRVSGNTDRKELEVLAEWISNTIGLSTDSGPRENEESRILAYQR